MDILLTLDGMGICLGDGYGCGYLATKESFGCEA